MTQDPQDPQDPLPDELPSIPSIVQVAADPPSPPPVNPAWAKELRALYTAVVEEPLPETFVALLSKLAAED